MTIVNHILGFPRIGLKRELKKAQEQYWDGKITQQQLVEIGREIRARHWHQQQQQGLDYVSVGDFAWYDHVLTTSLMVGNVPARHQNLDQQIDLDTLFRVARGRAPTGMPAAASDMTKWFNTNYHYIVPEFHADQHFYLAWTQLLDEVDEAIALGYKAKPTLLGPLTYLWLGKSRDGVNKLSLLPALLVVYQQLLSELARRNIEWVQIDEPALVLELPIEWLSAYVAAYSQLQGDVKLLLATYFGGITHHIDIIANLPIQGLHIDLVAGKDDIQIIDAQLSPSCVLSLGVINGRNVWKTDLGYWYDRLSQYTFERPIWLGSSCSLLHSPIDVSAELKLEEEVRNWFSFAVQKCYELSLLTKALNAPSREYLAALQEYSQPLYNRRYSARVHCQQVEERLTTIKSEDSQRSLPYTQRAVIQQQRLNLPLFPTTTIGSFPQTDEIRALRRDLKQGKIGKVAYQQGIERHIAQTIKEQEQLDIDVLVHGEAERNDMVEYFGEHLEGFVFTQNGWVQSYGSRCVKPPVIVGDIYRKEPMTVDWICYAQSLTNKPVKGMLTGPITILCWSFLREDIAPATIAKQIALALRDEVNDLECAGISIIQIDEPALREGLPLKKLDWDAYLTWAVDAFKLSSSGVKDETQIHTHMCYSEFNDIMPAIRDLDADVITIETSRSNMELLQAFDHFAYPNAIGPGVYDIHSPNVPTIDWMTDLMKKAAIQIPKERLWINPDCGLKTRKWAETRQSLANMVEAAKQLRETV